MIIPQAQAFLNVCAHDFLRLHLRKSAVKPFKCDFVADLPAAGYKLWHEARINACF